MFDVQFITHFTDTITYLDSVRIALEGGCRWIQLRMKEATEEEAEVVARQAQALCSDYGAVFIIDDRVKLVKKIGADGVHLGKQDMPVGEAGGFWELHSVSAGQLIRLKTYGDMRWTVPIISVVALFGLRQPSKS